MTTQKIIKLFSLLSLVFACAHPAWSTSLNLERINVRPHDTLNIINTILKNSANDPIFISSKLENLIKQLRRKNASYNVITEKNFNFENDIFNRLPLDCFEKGCAAYVIVDASDKNILTESEESLETKSLSRFSRIFHFQRLDGYFVDPENLAKNIYIKTPNISDLKNHVDKNTIVFLDYDETIFMPQSRDINGLIDKTMEKNVTAAVINEVAKNSFATFVLTNRSYSIDDEFFKVEKSNDGLFVKSPVKIANNLKMTLELKKNGIEIARQSLFDSFFINEKIAQIKGFQRGVYGNIIFSAASGLANFALQNPDDPTITVKDFYGIPRPIPIEAKTRVNKPITSHVGKAITALEVIKAAGLMADKIVFVDDTPEIALSFHNLMQKFQYNSVVLEYQKASQEDYHKELESIISWINLLSERDIDQASKISAILRAQRNGELEKTKALSLILELPGLTSEEQTDALIQIVMGESITQLSLQQKQDILQKIMSSSDQRAAIERAIQEKQR